MDLLDGKELEDGFSSYIEGKDDHMQKEATTRKAATRKAAPRG